MEVKNKEKAFNKISAFIITVWMLEVVIVLACFLIAVLIDQSISTRNVINLSGIPIKSLIETVEVNKKSQRYVEYNNEKLTLYSDKYILVDKDGVALKLFDKFMKYGGLPVIIK